MEYEFPFKFKNLTEDEQKILEWLNTDGQPKDVVRLEGTRTCCPGRIRELGKIFYNFKPRKDDIWLIGFPRSGTTLTQEILYLLGTDLNYEKAASEIMDIRFPILNMALSHESTSDLTYERANLEEKTKFWAHKYLEELNERRFIKTHYGFSMFHPKLLEIGCKVVFIARNPKDVVTSMSRYPYLGKIKNYSFKKVWDIFKHDLPKQNGNYFEMLEEAWERRNNKNLLILFYEEVNADKKGALLKIADFLGKQLTKDELDKLLKHLQIDSFKENKSLNNDHLVERGFYAKNENFAFIRKGKSGGWKDVIPPELVKEIDEWALENLRKIPDFRIPESWKIAMEIQIE